MSSGLPWSGLRPLDWLAVLVIAAGSATIGATVAWKHAEERFGALGDHLSTRRVSVLNDSGEEMIRLYASTNRATITMAFDERGRSGAKLDVSNYDGSFSLVGRRIELAADLPDINDRMAAAQRVTLRDAIGFDVLELRGYPQRGAVVSHGWDFPQRQLKLGDQIAGETWDFDRRKPLPNRMFPE